MLRAYIMRLFSSNPSSPHLISPQIVVVLLSLLCPTRLLVSSHHRAPQGRGTQIPIPGLPIAPICTGRAISHPNPSPPRRCLRPELFRARNGGLLVGSWELGGRYVRPRQAAVMASAAREKRLPPALPLATLIGRELRAGGSERPALRYGHAGFAKRGEDYFLVKPHCLRVPGDPSSAFSVFAVFDGHNGVSAAVFSKEHLLEQVMSALPPDIGREDWLQELPRALVAGFVKTDIDFQRKGEVSGTTATLVVVDGFTVTVASVGDSRCILDMQGGEVQLLTVDHRLEENVEERERVTASGGEVSRLNLFGGQQVGPLRCWPGGLCLSRSIGDMDVGEFIVPIPHVKQVKLSNVGGRLIIASDGIWDALSNEAAAKACRGLPAELAAKLVVKQALKKSGLKDDTTCVVVDIIPSDHRLTSPQLSPKRKQNKFKSLLFGRRSHSSIGKLGGKSASFGSVEELFEEGSAMLEERLGRNLSLKAASPPFRCAICQVDQEPFEGLMAENGGSYCSSPYAPWGGPYLCLDCRKKKDAMEGKRSSRSTACR